MSPCLLATDLCLVANDQYLLAPNLCLQATDLYLLAHESPEPVRHTYLCIGCGVIQGSLQGMAQSFREVLFQDQIQPVPTQLNGQNCKGKQSVLIDCAQCVYIWLVNIL